MIAADLASAGLLDQDGRQLQKLSGSPVNLAWGISGKWCLPYDRGPDNGPLATLGHFV